jgi:hypothetical protein
VYLILIYSKIPEGEKILSLPPLPAPTVRFPEERNYYIHHVHINFGAFPPLCLWMSSPTYLWNKYEWVSLEIEGAGLRNWSLTSYAIEVPSFASIARVQLHRMVLVCSVNCLHREVLRRTETWQRESDGSPCKETALQFYILCSNLTVKNCKCWKCALLSCHLVTPCIGPLFLNSLPK